jgi:hypothetical protein
MENRASPDSVVVQSQASFGGVNSTNYQADNRVGEGLVSPTSNEMKRHNFMMSPSSQLEKDLSEDANMFTKQDNRPGNK